MLEQSSSDRERLTYAAFGDAATEIARAVIASGYQPEVIVAIARGGLPLAGCLSYLLDVKTVATINVEFYTGVDSRLPHPVMLPPLLDLSDFADRRVLVVDDVADTGNTLAMVFEMLNPVCAEVRDAVIYHKPQSIRVPNYFWRTTSAWIDFPWSSPEAIAAVGQA